MPGRIFDLDEPHPNVALETIRQAIKQTLADLLANGDVVAQLILDALDVQIRNDGQDDATDELVIATLDDQIRDTNQDDVIETLILDSLSGGVP